MEGPPAMAWLFPSLSCWGTQLASIMYGIDHDQHKKLENKQPSLLLFLETRRYYCTLCNYNILWWLIMHIYFSILTFWTA